MTVHIKKDNHGNNILWSEIGGKAVPLAVNSIFMRLADGHIFTSGAPGTRGVTLARLRPHEPEMIQHWLVDKAAEIAPVIFAGNPPPDG